MKSPQLKLLTTRRFLPLFITQFLDAFNNNVFKNALVILITFRIADLIGMSPQLLVAIAAGLFILPFFLFSATAGQLADKYEKARMISIVKGVDIVWMLFAILGFYYQNTYFLLFILFALGVSAAFFGPLKYAILPDHLSDNELIAGNGLIEAGTFIAILLGTILGGLLILQLYGEWIIALLVLFFAIAGWGSSLLIPRTHHHQMTLTVSYNFIRETFNILVYSKQNHKIFLYTLGISWFWLFGATFLSELPVYVKDTLHADENTIVFFLTLFSIGLAIGSMFCNHLLKSKIHGSYVPIGLLGMSVFTIDLYFSRIASQPETLMTVFQFLSSFTGWRITLDLLCIAIFGGLYTVPLYALLQSQSAPTHRARVIASNNVINALSMVVAAIATAAMIKFGFSVADVFLTMAICNGFIVLYAFKVFPDLLLKLTSMKH